jgi:hypothetical protein
MFKELADKSSPQEKTQEMTIWQILGAADINK